MSTKFLRKRQVAERYSVHERSIDRWKLDGRLPAPHMRGRIPLWSEHELEQLDRRSTVAANQNSRSA